MVGNHLHIGLGQPHSKCGIKGAVLFAVKMHKVINAALGKADIGHTANYLANRNSYGAAFILMMTAEQAQELGYTPYARWIAGTDAGVEPANMHLGPIYSNEKALKMAGLTAEAVDLWECGTLSAAQSLAVMEKSGISQDKWADDCLAVGHAGGATGGRLTMDAMQQLCKTGGQYAVVSCCCGGGHGTSLVMENLRR